MRILSWNVNGIRAVYNKGEFLNIFEKESPDIVCIQETKAQKEQLGDEILEIEGYNSFFESADKKGYSGVAIYSKVMPISVKKFDIERFDAEGRYIELEFEKFILINCYFPNSQEKGKRLDYKVDFCDELLKALEEKKGKGKAIIITGDYNIAHQPIDLARPKDNEDNPGYLPEERAWMSKFLEAGYVDSFRKFYPEETKYTWWSYRTRAREKNIGWRIDYFCIDKESENILIDSGIRNDIYGSDHCPIYIDINVN